MIGWQGFAIAGGVLAIAAFLVWWEIRARRAEADRLDRARLAKLVAVKDEQAKIAADPPDRARVVERMRERQF